MRVRILILSLVIASALSCSNGNDPDAKKDSANTLNDTFPASRVKDSVAADSNPADATKIDSGNRTTN